LQNGTKDMDWHYRQPFPQRRRHRAGMLLLFQSRTSVYLFLDEERAVASSLQSAQLPGAITVGSRKSNAGVPCQCIDNIAIADFFRRLVFLRRMAALSIAR
jgi:hypothetical protein